MINLFNIVVPTEKLHYNFKQLLNNDENEARNLLLEWTEGFLDRDNKIVKEFQTTFNSTFWELYLFNVLKKWQIEIDFSFDRPDFNCKSEKEFIIEAVISNNAHNDPPEWDRNIIIKEKDEIVKKATFRLANTIISKYRKYISDYSNLLHVKNKPFIIAIAPFEQPFFWEQSISAITQVLYGIKGYKYTNDDINNERKILSTDYIEYIEKENGAHIELGFFSNNFMPEISAIIYNNCATFGKIRALTKDRDGREMLFSFSRFNKNGLYTTENILEKKSYSESIEDGMNIYINPHAKNPISDSFIKLFPSTFSYDPFSKAIIGGAENNALFKRMVIRPKKRKNIS